MEAQDLKAWRARNKLTQEHAAAELDISRRSLVAYEQGESPIPRTVEYACKWLDKNPTAIEPRDDSLRLVLTDGGIASTREVAVTALTLIQKTLARLKEADLVSSEMLREIFDAAIETHLESPARNQPWVKAVINLVRDIYYDLEPSKRRAPVALDRV